MPIQVTCPGCGAELADCDAPCAACGGRGIPATTEDLIASWVTDSPTLVDSSPVAQDRMCQSCGYLGAMIASPEGDWLMCPACSTPWNDHGGTLRKILCSDCGKAFLLSEVHLGKMIICPGCHSLLGCLLANPKKTSIRLSALYGLIPLNLAFCLGYSLASPIWSERIPWRLLSGISVMLLPVTWTLVGLAIIHRGPSRRSRFTPPGLAACIAVSAASFLSLCYGGDHSYLSFTGSRGFVATAALRAVQPLPLAAAVAGTWLVLVFDRRWKPEPSWIDRLARALACYWLAAGLLVPLLRWLLF